MSKTAVPFEDGFYTERQLVELTNGIVAQPTWAGWRFRGVGPRFVKLGKRILYPKRDFHAWMDANLVETKGGQ